MIHSLDCLGSIFHLDCQAYELPGWAGLPGAALTVRSEQPPQRRLAGCCACHLPALPAKYLSQPGLGFLEARAWAV